MLRYTNSSLGTGVHSDFNLGAFIRAESIYVRASDAIEKVEIYDVTGKLIKTYQPEKNAYEFSDAFVFPSSIYLAKIKLANGSGHNIKLAN